MSIPSISRGLRFLYEIIDLHPFTGTSASTLPLWSLLRYPLNDPEPCILIDHRSGTSVCIGLYIQNTTICCYVWENYKVLFLVLTSASGVWQITPLSPWSLQMIITKSPVLQWKTVLFWLLANKYAGGARASMPSGTGDLSHAFLSSYGKGSWVRSISIVISGLLEWLTTLCNLCFLRDHSKPKLWHIKQCRVQSTSVYKTTETKTMGSCCSGRGKPLVLLLSLSIQGAFAKH